MLWTKFPQAQEDSEAPLAHWETWVNGKDNEGYSGITCKNINLCV